VIFEAGEAEMSRDEYAKDHLGADMEFSKATARKVVDRRSGVAGEAAWVLTRTTTTGTFRGKEIKSRGNETIVLKKTASGWLIVHIHWSSAKMP
jgi:ketosteroid isomerase-like protein